MDAGWRPYALGQWVPTDLGWTWLSDEPFGWATYHYGRWYLDPVYGWMWIPGDEWAPAWVAWRADDDYVGWAPLPPRYRLRPRFGLRLMDVDLPPEAFLFVPEPLFLQPSVVSFAIAPTRVPTFFDATRDFTRYRLVDDLIVNEGVPLDRIQRRIGRPVPRYRLVDLEPDRGRRARVAGDRIALFRPRVGKTKVAPPPAREAARRSVMTPADAAAVREAARSTRLSSFAITTGKGRGQPPRVRDLREERGRGAEGRALRPGPSRELRRQDTVRPSEARQGRSAEVRRLGAAPPQREVRKSRGAEVRKPRGLARNEVRPDRGRAEVRRSVRGERAPERRMRPQRSDRSGQRLSSPSRHPERRPSARPPQRHHRPQRDVRPERQGGGGRRGAMRSPGGPQGGRQGKAKRGGDGRGH